jgi:hypothetical protein
MVNGKLETNPAAAYLASQPVPNVEQAQYASHSSQGYAYPDPNLVYQQQPVNSYNNNTAAAYQNPERTPMAMPQVSPVYQTGNYYGMQLPPQSTTPSSEWMRWTQNNLPVIGSTQPHQIPQLGQEFVNSASMLMSLRGITDESGQVMDDNRQWPSNIISLSHSVVNGSG